MKSAVRYGSLVRVKQECLERYKTLHAAVWPGVLKIISRSNIRNYSIYYRNGFLFSYFEYTGTNYEQDMENMAAEPLIKEWWDVCMPCHDPLPDRAAGEWWATMEEVFHMD